MKSFLTCVILVGAALLLTTNRAAGVEEDALSTEDSGKQSSVRDVLPTSFDSFPTQVQRSQNFNLRPVIPAPTRSVLHRQSGDEQVFQPTRIPFRPRTNQQDTQLSTRLSPSVTIMTPSAYGAAWGNAGIGLGFQQRTRFTDRADGVVGVGFGLGDPKKSVGLAVGITITDLWGDTFEDGTLNFKLHRQLPGDVSLAAGMQGAVSWGETDGGSSVYGVVTKRFSLREDLSQPLSQVHLSVGVGTGQYRSESNIENSVDSVGMFGSVAVRIYEPVTAIAEWTGQDLTLGVSFIPFPNVPFAIAPAITDVTGTAGDGTRFILGIGYGFSFDRF